MLNIARPSVLPVTIDSDLPRYMRHNLYIEGLIDLYQHIEAWGKVGVEVGSFWGESAEIAAQFLATLSCVDPWLVPEDEAKFIARMARFHNVAKLTMTSEKAAEHFADECLDMVYIDACHEYPWVRLDLLLWIPKVRMGGWITGHDYDGLADHTGVVQAVDEILGGPGTRFVDSSFAVLKTEAIADRARSIPIST